MNYRSFFFSCDWGTTSFRLRLVERSTSTVVEEVSNDLGVSTIHRLWSSEGKNVIEKKSHFISALGKAIGEIERRMHQSCAGVPVVLSGMISSSIGLTVLPYKKIPLSLDGNGFFTEMIAADNEFPHPLLIISGLCSEDDVMRGEETQVLGALSSGDKTGKQVCVLPGTHSKHVFIEDNRIIGFRTYMTGEIFSLLSSQSILRESVERSPQGLQNPVLRRSFEDGVAEGVAGNVLNASFKARSRLILGKADAQANYYYLSGTLIGTELGDLRLIQNQGQVIVIGSDELVHSYQIAMEYLRISSVRTVRADAATILGHRHMLSLWPAL